jgi:G:T/U-mismatch repair DNA glycosylase
VSHIATVRVEGREVPTLSDILPTAGPMKMLIVAKTPAPISVEAGHYFQGRQGRMFWNRLHDYGLLTTPPGAYEDDFLLEHGYGLTDIVKAPRSYGSEPSDEEYREGLERILELVAHLQPAVVMFVYKRVLDQISRLSFSRREKSQYGFNASLDPLLGSRAFVFPMPGTHCTRAEADIAMTSLADALADRA